MASRQLLNYFDLQGMEFQQVITEDEMKKSIIKLCTIATMILAMNAFSCDEHGTTGIVEDNNLKIYAWEKSKNSMDEATFNAVIDKVEDAYKDIISKMGGRLQVERKWDDATVNAYAQRSGSTWKVSMFGGLARHETVTPDGFALVVCHEIGHHIGGAPKKGGMWGNSWASNEGQADYWGTTKCMKRVFASEDNKKIVAKLNVPEIVKTACSKSFSSQDDQYLCQRAAMAGESLANLFKALRNLDKAPGFDTPDTKVVSATDHNHPQPQCRMDTYYMGSLCDKTLNEDVSQRDAETGVCNRVEGYGAREGVRPLCWYKPERI